MAQPRAHRSNRSLLLALAAPVALFIAACSTTPGATGTPGAPGGSTAPQESMGPESMAPASMGPSTPIPTDMQTLSLDFLPQASFDPSALQVACDEATDANAISCADATALGVRIMRLMSAAPVDWLAIERDELGSVTITGQAQGEEGPEIFTFGVDTAANLFTFPIEAPDATFPTS